MNIGSIVQIGGAVRHKPLPPLATLNEDSFVEEAGERNRTFKNDQEPTIGGFLWGGQFSWRASGHTIEVLDLSTCSRLAAWTFGAILHNSNAMITCVCSIGAGIVTHIAVGIDLGHDRNPQGMIGILSLRRSRITRAFQFRHKVTNICMVLGGDRLVDSSTIAPELRACQGLLAVATSHPSVYLVDLALDLGDDEITSDEVSPASFVDLSIPDSNAEAKRNLAVSKGLHPIICLSDNFCTNGFFQLLGPDENILYEAPSNSINISALLYIPQLVSLVVGYNFGSFQIINLSAFTIDCASPYEENVPPVFSFAYQEPENDPRSFVYLWVCRSSSSEKCLNNNNQVGVCQSQERATCSLYAMNYDKKEWIEGHGLWFQGLHSVSPRFEFDIAAGVEQQLLSITPSKIFAATTIVGANPTSSAMSSLGPEMSEVAIPSDEESDPVPELSLAMFCWEGSFLDQGRKVTQHYIAIFDINQWYQAHMPGHLRIEENNLCPFMSFHVLDKVPKSLNEKLLSAAPGMGSWTRHSRSRCEIDWYPSSLSYELNLLTSEGFVTYHCPSIQQSAITLLMQQGPGAIVDPHNAFSACLFAGMLSPEMVTNGIGLSAVSEREQLLNVALEYNLLPFIIQCVMEFSEGRFSHVGCSLQLLLEWAWNKVRTLKESYCTLCIPLFAFAPEGGILSDSGLATLHQHLTYLSHLHTIVTSIRDHAGEITTISASELEGRCQVTHLLQLHLRSILWFYHCGLLPQCNSNDQLDGKCIPFPSDALQKIYSDRRDDIKNLDSNLNGSDLLLIDCMMESCGSLLSETLAQDCREGSQPLYPPRGLSSLLSMYLLPGITTPMKHRIIQYLFLDLASLLSDNYFGLVEELVKFPSSVAMSPSLIKVTQAFWLIDHKEFEAGLSVLLDPLVDPNDITMKQHRLIFKSFLYQGQEYYALSYLQIRQPPELDLEDIRISLTVLLANGRIREAFHYQRKRGMPSNTKALLNHLFTGCEKLGRLETILHLPLSSVEEETFIEYLLKSSYPSAQDILLVYYLQQSRYSELRNLKNAFKSACNSSSLRQNTRTALVQGYLSHLPDVRAHMGDHFQNVGKASKTIYLKPQPIIPSIRPSSSASISKATFQHRIDNLQEPPDLSFRYTPFRSKSSRIKYASNWFQDLGAATNPTTPSAEPESDKSSHFGIVVPVRQRDSPTAFVGMTTASRIDDSSSSKHATTLREEVAQAMEEILKNSLGSSTVLDNISLKVSVDVVSLLKTPPTRNRKLASSNPSSTKESSLPETPQSILKVRKILQRPLSPAPTTISPISSFPSYRPATKSPQDRNLDRSLPTMETSPVTPKQLRFDLPSVSVSVNDDNMIVNRVGEMDTFPDITPLSVGRKRTISEETSTSSSDTPTPRKPLPRYVEVENSLSDPEELEKCGASNEMKDSYLVNSEIVNEITICKGAIEGSVTKVAANESNTSALSLDNSFSSPVTEGESNILMAVEELNNNTIPLHIETTDVPPVTQIENRDINLVNRKYSAHTLMSGKKVKEKIFTDISDSADGLKLSSFIPPKVPGIESSKRVLITDLETSVRNFFDDLFGQISRDEVPPEMGIEAPEEVAEVSGYHEATGGNESFHTVVDDNEVVMQVADKVLQSTDAVQSPSTDEGWRSFNTSSGSDLGTLPGALTPKEVSTMLSDTSESCKQADIPIISEQDQKLESNQEILALDSMHRDSLEREEDKIATGQFSDDSVISKYTIQFCDSEDETVLEISKNVCKDEVGMVGVSTGIFNAINNQTSEFSSSMPNLIHTEGYKSVQDQHQLENVSHISFTAKDKIDIEVHQQEMLNQTDIPVLEFSMDDTESLSLHINESVESNTKNMSAGEDGKYSQTSPSVCRNVLMEAEREGTDPSLGKTVELTESVTTLGRNRRLSGKNNSTPPKTPDKAMKLTEFVTPLRRSRRLSGEASSDEKIPLTPCRRSVTPSKVATTPSSPPKTPDKAMKLTESVTPLRRSRRLSGKTLSEEKTPLTPCRRGVTPSKINTTPLTPCRRGVTPSKINTTPSTPAKGITTYKLGPSPDKAMKLTESVAPLRRSRRLSGKTLSDEKTPLTPCRRGVTPSKVTTTPSTPTKGDSSPSKIPTTPSTPSRRLGRVHATLPSKSASPSHARREYRESDAIPSKLYTTPKQTLNETQEDTEAPLSEDLIEFDTLNKVEHQISTSSKKTPEAAEGEHHSKPSNSPSGKKRRGRKAEVRVDTPRRRSARISGSSDSLRTIVEEGITAAEPEESPRKDKKKPGKLKKSCESSGPLLETIREDSESSNSSGREMLEVIESNFSPVASPVMESSAVPQSATQRDPSSGGRKRSPATTPLEEKAWSRSSRRKRVSSTVHEITPERVPMKSLDFDEGKENMGGNNVKYTLISPYEDEEKVSFLPMEIFAKVSRRQSLSTSRRSKATFNLTLPRDHGGTKRKSSRKSGRIGSSSIKPVTEETPHETIAAPLPPYAEAPTEKEEVPHAVTYNLLQTSGERPDHLAPLRFALVGQKRIKRKSTYNSSRGRLPSLSSLPQENAELEEVALQPLQKRSRKVSASKRPENDAGIVQSRRKTPRKQKASSDSQIAETEGEVEAGQSDRPLIGPSNGEPEKGSTKRKCRTSGTR